MRFRRPDGRLAKLTLGRVPKLKRDDDAPVEGTELTLAEARELGGTINRQRGEGRDVVGLRRREKMERKAQGAKTFAQAALDFIEQHSRRENRSWEQQARILGIRPDADGKLGLIPRGSLTGGARRPSPTS